MISLLRETNPFAIITAAHLKTKATKKDTQSRYSWRWKITTALYESGFSKQDILNIYRLIDWLMMLPEDLTKRFTEDLIKYEEEKKMPYIMSAERIGREGYAARHAAGHAALVLDVSVPPGLRPGFVIK